MEKIIFTKVKYFIAVVSLIAAQLFGFSQTVIRYQNTLRGGATLFGNSWLYSTSPTGTFTIRPDVDADAATAHSTSADLILPSNATIVKAYLSVERANYQVNIGPLTSVKIKVPGAGAYTTLNASTALTSRVTQTNYHQTIFDITSLMPADGFVSTVGGGVNGRYFLADPLPLMNAVVSNMGGWSIIVVYSSPSSKYRNVTVADGWQYFLNSSVNTDITGVNVPVAGAFNTVVGVTGTYGDRGSSFSDFISFGLASGTLTNLADPMTNATNDALNSSIAWAAQNNVNVDAGLSINGNITTRNPVSVSHLVGTASESWDFDADIFNASGILPNSSAPLTVRLQQSATSGDALVSGSYFISIDAQEPVKLTKAVSPASFNDGQTAAYTFTLNNTTAGNVAQTGLSFTDVLPGNIRIAATPNVVVTGLTGGTVTAPANGNTVTVSNYAIAANTTATITVNITNVPGQLNSSCAANPDAFTNKGVNITSKSANIDNQIANPCVIVNPACNAGTTGPVVH